MYNRLGFLDQQVTDDSWNHGVCIMWREDKTASTESASKFVLIHIGYTVWTNLCSRWSWSAGITDVWQYRLSVTSWTYGAFLSVSFHRCHPSRCQSPARCRRWLMGLADPIFCIPLMFLMPWLLAANFDRRLYSILKVLYVYSCTVMKNTFSM